MLKVTEKLCKDKNGVVTCDKKNIPGVRQGGFNTCITRWDLTQEC